MAHLGRPINGQGGDTLKLRSLISSAAAFAVFIGLSLTASTANANSEAMKADGVRGVVVGAGVTAMATLRPMIAAARGAPPPEIAQHIRDAAAAYMLDRNLLEAVAWQESRYKQGARSNRGAAGVMQLMPGTAEDLGVDRHDARQNIFGGAAYLKALMVRFGGDVTLALAAYNAGPNAVQRYGGVPPFEETQNYVTSITGRTAEIAALSLAASGGAVTLQR